MQQIISFELDGVLDKTKGKAARAFVARDSGVADPDGDPSNPTYVTDAWGQFEGKGGGPGVRGSVGYAVWMEDSQRFEVLSLSGP